MLSAKQKFILINAVLILACLWWIIHGSPLAVIGKTYAKTFLMLNGALLIYAWMSKRGI